MKSRAFLFYSLFLSITAISQSTSIDLTFTAVNNITHIQTDSMKIMNRTQGGDTVLFWPDTVLSLYFTDIEEHEQQPSGFKVFQNYPNPVKDLTTISLYIPDKDEVAITVMDLLGRVIYRTEKTLERGHHYFSFTPGMSNLYLFQAHWRGNTSSIKILHTSTNSHSILSLEYQGGTTSEVQLKQMEEIQDFNFALGDQLLYIAYKDSLESGIYDYPEESQSYTFQFATNIPCPGTPIVEYGRQVYNTIQIFSQCWLKENLNVGIYPIYGDQSDNGIIEKFCYMSEDTCTKYGGIYQWFEAMQYSSQEGTQGICPPGWHIPTVSDWKILEGVADSLYGIGDPVWDWNINWKGYNAGDNLKTTNGWFDFEYGTDFYGFSALPGGLCYLNGIYNNTVGAYGYWWTSSPGEQSQEGHYFTMQDWVHGVGNGEAFHRYGMSIRCIRGEVYDNPIELYFTATHGYIHTQIDSVRIINLTTQGNEITLIWPDTILILGNDLLFNTGDELLIIGFAENLQSAIQDYPDENDTIKFQFATNIPCPGTPIVEYEGHFYSTRQIFSQCWLTENLNVGMMITGNQEMADNDLLEKYCYDNEIDSCYKYGGLYQWSEMMQYSEQERARGICPPGWHIPSDLEWKILEGSIDSIYHIFDTEWDGEEFRGYDAGKKIKSTFGWFDEGNGTNIFGFTGLPSGKFYSSTATFEYITKLGCWWTSTEFSYGESYSRLLLYTEDGIYRSESEFAYKGHGFSVRCLRDN